MVTATALLLAVVAPPQGGWRRDGRDACWWDILETAVVDGADMLDLRDADTTAVAAVRARYPDVAVCADTGCADLVRDVAAARRTGADLVCANPADAMAAVRTGTLRDTVVVAAPPDEVGEVAAAGWRVLGEADAAVGEADAVEVRPDGLLGGDDTRSADSATVASVSAAAAVCSLLGARIVRTRYVRQVRRALDMTASIQGMRPPAWAIRGLA